MKPLISIIIPCFNTAEYLPQCMASLEKQTIGFEKLQFIFVDDASTDEGKTWRCICEFEQRHPKEVVAIQLEKNMSQGGAKNVGISYAEADYIGFVDSDDWIEPEMYEKLYACARDYQCDAVDCGRMLNYPDGREVIYQKKENCFDQFENSIVEGGNHWIRDFTHAGYGGGLVTCIFRKQLIIENEIKFPEHLKYEDNYWSAVIRLYIRSFYHIADNCYHYRQREDSTVYQKNVLYHLDQMQIEEKKIETYQKLGIFDKYYRQIEFGFLYTFYYSTLIKLFTKFDNPPFDVYQRMVKRVRELLPDYLDNPYFKENDFKRTLLKLIDKQLNPEQFQEIGKMVLQYCYTSENMKYN